MTLADILKRLREATGAELELDGLIAQAFGLLPPEARYSTENVFGECEPHWVSGGYGDYKFFEPEPYTASLDAAIALVEKTFPDRHWEVDRRGNAAIYYHDHTRYHDAIRADAETPALALLIALLEAPPEQEQRKP